MDVSILICTYGDVSWRKLAIDRAVPSAANQGALEVLQFHTDKDLATTRNDAAKIARGDWLCFLDADDELAPYYLDAMRQVKTGPWGALLVPAVQYVHPDRPLLPARILTTGRPLIELNRAVVGTLVPRRLFLELGGFSNEWPVYEDWELWLRCSARVKMIDVKDAVYRVFVRPESRNVHNVETCQRVYEQIRRRHEATFAV